MREGEEELVKRDKEKKKKMGYRTLIISPEIRALDRIQDGTITGLVKSRWQRSSKQVGIDSDGKGNVAAGIPRWGKEKEEEVVEEVIEVSGSGKRHRQPHPAELALLLLLVLVLVLLLSPTQLNLLITYVFE
ncbi:hypothetical protein M0802_005930 [Mischocyttarus mexicanus]|nr:hypothetical protein M0802_005930 [Mischocyttarus mexicanus]